MTDNRKCSFYIYPERNAADRVADGFLEKLPQKERGRAMRAMMLCGAALMKQDERLPFLIAEFLTESTSMQDIQRIISSTLPQQDTGEMARLVEAFLQATGGGSSAVSPAGGAAPDKSPAEKPVPEAPKDKNLEEIRKNVQQMFPDGD
ncbi:plasmid stability family protein [Salmonella enterica subsp. enterica serovar Give]|nr:plasmid stability family protein [Salmonella enterica subsp. enterica serovar Give]ECA4141879.1 plasmid stability family protein [Salmonella enterica subsp. enterica serovar Give]